MAHFSISISLEVVTCTSNTWGFSCTSNTWGFSCTSNTEFLMSSEMTWISSLNFCNNLWHLHQPNGRSKIIELINIKHKHSWSKMWSAFFVIHILPEIKRISFREKVDKWMPQIISMIKDDIQAFSHYFHVPWDTLYVYSYVW